MQGSVISRVSRRKRVKVKGLHMQKQGHLNSSFLLKSPVAHLVGTKGIRMTLSRKDRRGQKGGSGRELCAE